MPPDYRAYANAPYGRPLPNPAAMKLEQGQGRPLPNVNASSVAPPMFPPPGPSSSYRGMGDQQTGSRYPLTHGPPSVPWPQQQQHLQQQQQQQQLQQQHQDQQQHPQHHRHYPSTVNPHPLTLQGPPRSGASSPPFSSATARPTSSHSQARSAFSPAPRSAGSHRAASGSYAGSAPPSATLPSGPYSPGAAPHLRGFPSPVKLPSLLPSSSTTGSRHSMSPAFTLPPIVSPHLSDYHSHTHSQPQSPFHPDHTGYGRPRSSHSARRPSSAEGGSQVSPATTPGGTKPSKRMDLGNLVD